MALEFSWTTPHRSQPCLGAIEAELLAQGMPTYRYEGQWHEDRRSLAWLPTTQDHQHGLGVEETPDYVPLGTSLRLSMETGNPSI